MRAEARARAGAKRVEGEEREITERENEPPHRNGTARTNTDGGEKERKSKKVKKILV